MPLRMMSMALVSTNAGDKTHAAGVVLVSRVVKTLRRRQAVLCLPKLQKTPKGRASRALGHARNLNLVGGWRLVAGEIEGA